MGKGKGKAGEEEDMDQNWNWEVYKEGMAENSNSPFQQSETTYSDETRHRIHSRSILHDC